MYAWGTVWFPHRLFYYVGQLSLPSQPKTGILVSVEDKANVLPCKNKKPYKVNIYTCLLEPLPQYLEWRVWKVRWDQKVESPVSQFVKARWKIICRRKYWRDMFKEREITGLSKGWDGGEGQTGISQRWFPEYWMTSVWSVSPPLSVC